MKYSVFLLSYFLAYWALMSLAFPNMAWFFVRGDTSSWSWRLSGTAIFSLLSSISFYILTSNFIDINNGYFSGYVVYDILLTISIFFLLTAFTGLAFPKTVLFWLNVKNKGSIEWRIGAFVMYLFLYGLSFFLSLNYLAFFTDAP